MPEYGSYDTDNHEYIITKPDTPTPWINYLGAGHYGGIISNTAGGFSFDRDPRNRRVTRYRYNGVPADQPGRYVYLRDQETGEYWSPTWQPVTARKLEAYACRHGSAYTCIQSRHKGIAASLTYFIPLSSPAEDCPCELWVLRLSNVDNRPRHLRTFSYVELSYYDAHIDQTNLDWGMHILHSRYDDGTLYTSTQFLPTMTFFSSSAPPVGYDSDREMFLGAYRDLSNPVVVESGSTQQSQAPRGNNIGCLCHELTLLPGEEREIIYILGVTDNPSSIRGVLEHFHQPERVREAHEALRDDWNTYLSYLQVDTPDPQMNAMLNFWNPVQCRTTLFWSRFVSAYESGLGRGMGTRDSAQDCLGTVHAVPERVRETLATLLHLQFKDGHTWHQVFPLIGEGGPGLASEFPDWPQWFCDDHLWLVMAVCAYLRETGNFNFLDQRISYWDGGEGSVWEHMLGAVAFTLDHLGPHHLPRLGFSDWDDTMNLDHGSGNAESVWCAQQFCRTMLDLSELCDHLGKVEEDARFRKLHQEMARAINGSCWDGAWYVRAFDDAGKPVGTRTAARHQIGLNSQTWAIIGEIDGGEHATTAMDSAHKLLDTPFGLRLMWPAYDRYDPTVRGTSTYPPGAKENGGIFCHAHAWAIIAAAKLGWGERAYQYYRQILPLAQEDLDLYRAEPYVYSQNICAPEHPQYGMGRNAWLTGTAAWTYVAGTQWILGIRPTYLGLKITPVIPNGWQGYTATRIFRGVTYHITVQRIGAGNFPSLWVDGKALTGDTVPIPQDWRKEVQVRVELGEQT